MQSVELLKKSNGTFENLTRSEVRTVISELTPQLAAMIGDVKLEARFTESLINICLDVKLIKCDAISVISAAYTSATLNLSINPTMGEGYVVPFSLNVGTRDRATWKNVAQFQIGYNGYKKMAFNAGVQSVFGKAVYKGDEFSFAFGMSPTLSHIPKFTSQEIEYVYFTWTINGIKEFDCVDKTWIENRRLRNKSQQANIGNPHAEPKDAWKTDYATMGIGKLIKYCRRFIPLSPEFVAMAERDESVMIGKLSDDGKLEITPHVEIESDASKVEEKEPVKRVLTRAISEQIILMVIKEGNDKNSVLSQYSEFSFSDRQIAYLNLQFTKKPFDPLIEHELAFALKDGDETTDTLKANFFFTELQEREYKQNKEAKNV